MKRTNKKGFTIVELVIVIAVIAILAAVLIPNISNLVKKANASADESLVRNLNTALSMDVEKHQTMDAALEAALKNGGYELTTIVTKNKDNKILWDSKNDCFVYMKKGASKPTYLPNTQEVKDVKPYDYFEIVTEKPTDFSKFTTYSIYAAWTADSTVTFTDLKVGFDAGKNTFASVEFVNNTNCSVLINTNGGKLTVNASKASVTHRGVATIVTINAVATKSYHENGKVDQINLKAGRVVVEGKAEVGSVLITATEITGTDEKNVSVEVKDNAILGAVAASEGKVVESLKTVVSGTTDVVTVVANSNGFAGGFGTEKAPFIINDELTLRALDNYTGKSDVYVKLIADIEMNLNVADKTISTLVAQITLKTNVHLNLNGKVIKPSQSSITADYGKASPLLFAVVQGTLTIEGDGTISCECGNNQVYGININGEQAKVVISNGNFYGAMTAIQVQKGSLEIYGGFFDMAPTCKVAVPQYAKYMINCIDAAYKEGSAILSLKGGSFVNFDPSENPEGMGTSYVAEGFKVTTELVNNPSVPSASIYTIVPSNE